MKFGVVVFPGSNCDADIQRALENDLKSEVVMLWHKDNNLSHFHTEDCIVLPGGFAYGDYLRCGALARFSPMMEQVIAFANKGGKVLGICNGFQILCEAGLLPGVLLLNDHQNFNCKNVYLKNAHANNRIGNHIKDDILKIPVAHGEGRYLIDDLGLEKLKNDDQILFYYSNAAGDVNESTNINGSVINIAGICNATKNVYGMMPHPERATNTALNNDDGLKILKAMI